MVTEKKLENCKAEKLDIMIKNGVIVNDTEKKSVISNIYNRKILRINIAKFMWIFILCLLFFIPSEIFNKIFDKVGFIGFFTFAGLILSSIIYHFLFSSIYRNEIQVKKNFKKMLKKGESLFCYESEVIDYCTSFSELDGADMEEEYMEEEYYLILTNDVKIPIGRTRYKELKEKNCQRVKVYFFKETLKYNVYYIASLK